MSGNAKNDTRPTIGELQEALDELKMLRRDCVNDLVADPGDGIMANPAVDTIIRYQLVIDALRAVIKERQRGEDEGEEIPGTDFR